MLFVPLFVALLATHAWKLREKRYRKMQMQEKIEESFGTLQRIAGMLTFIYDPHTVCMHLGIVRGIHPYIMLLMIPRSFTLQCLLQSALVHPYLMAVLALMSPVTFPEALFVTINTLYFLHK